MWVFPHSFTLILFCSVGFQRPTLTDSSHTIQTVQTLITAAIISSTFSTNITIIHEACSNIYITSFQLTLICGGIVKYITLYSHYTRLQLLFGKVLTLPQLMNKTNKVFEPKGRSE